MQAPTTVSVRDINGNWSVVETLPPKWSTVAPGGCFDATITLVDGARAPELQQGCLVRITTADSADAVWSGRLSQPVRRVKGSDTQWELPVEGTAAFLADTNLKYSPAVTRYDAWELGSGAGPVRTYRAGATVQSGNVPDQDNFNAMMENLPTGYIVGNDRVIARFNGYDDTDHRPAAIVGYHLDGVTSKNRSKFFGFLWHGQPTGTVQTILNPTSTGAKFTASLVSATTDDVVLGWQFLGPPVNTNDENPAVTSDELWCAFYTLTVWARLTMMDGGENTAYDPINDGLTPPDIVADLIGRGAVPAVSNNPSVSSIATNSSIKITSMDYGDKLVTPADILNDLIAIDPDFFWWVGAADASTGKAPFTWAVWPSVTLLLPPGVVVYDESGADSDLANQVKFTYLGDNSKQHTGVVTADKFTYPDTAGLDGIVEAEPIDLTGLASYNSALSVAQKWLAIVATLPRSATATVTVPVPDQQTGERIQPWHLRAGVTAHVPETGDDLKVTKVEVDAETATATLTLGSPRKTVADLVAQLSKKRSVTTNG